MYIDKTDIRIPYIDVDQLGIVYHGHYAKYYEIGRTEALRKLGWDYKAFEASGNGMVVTEMKSKFVRSARYDDVITVITEVRSLPTKKMTFHTEIINQDSTLLNIGEMNFVFVKKPFLKICSAPKALIDELTKIDNQWL